MDGLILDGLRKKLRTSFEEIDPNETIFFHWRLRRFWNLIKSNAVFSSLVDELTAKNGPFVQEVRKFVEPAIDNNEMFLYNQQEQQATAGMVIVEACIKKNRNIRTPDCELHTCAKHQASNQPNSVALSAFKSKFIEPLFEYIDDGLQDSHILLYLLLRYKKLVEWFPHDRDLIHHIFQSVKSRHEDHMALHCYRFLFLQGLEFHLSPHSMIGRIDFISELRNEGRLLFDAKVFRGNTNYIAKGVHQLYSYLCQYNHPWGALLIYDESKDKPLSFALPLSSSNVPYLYHNGKTMFMVTVDLCDRGWASDRGKLQTAQIDEGFLVQVLDDNGLGDADNDPQTG